MQDVKAWVARNYWKFLIPMLLIAMAAYVNYAPEYQLPGSTVAMNSTVQLVSEFILFLAALAATLVLCVIAMSIVGAVLCTIALLFIVGDQF